MSRADLPKTRGRPPGKRPRYLIALQALREKLASGEFAPGKPLPSYRDLVKTLGVSLMTVRLAIKELEREGRILVKPRQHAVVVKPASGTSELSGTTAIVLNAELAYSLREEERRIVISSAMEHTTGVSVFFQHETRWRFEIPVAVHEAPFRGVILYGPFQAQLLRQYESVRIPVVVLDQPCDAFKIHSVAAGNFEGTFDATQRLIGMGHRRLAFIRVLVQSLQNIDPDSEERMAGFHAACEQVQLSADQYQVFTSYHISTHLVAQEIVNARPRFTAVVATSASQGLEVLQAATQARRRVPEDLSIAVFHGANVSMHRNWSGPSVDFSQMGQIALDIINRVPSTPEHHRVRPTWHTGDTVAPPAKL